MKEYNNTYKPFYQAYNFNIREKYGAFSISAAVRPPYGSRNYPRPHLAGVS